MPVPTLMAAHPGRAEVAAPGAVGMRALVAAAVAGCALVPGAVQVLTGPDAGLPRAALALVEAAVVIAWAVGEAPAYRPRRRGWVVLGLVLAWAAGVVAATAAAPHVAPAGLRIAEWALHGLFGWALWSAFQDDRRALRWALAAVPVGLAVATTFVVVGGLMMPDPGRHDWMSLTPLFGNVRFFGFYALAGVVFSAWPWLNPDASRAARGWGWAGLALGWAVLLWSGGRGSSGAAFLAGLCLWGWAGPRRTLFALAFGTAFLAGLALSFAVPVGPGYGAERLLDAEAGGRYGFLSGRLELWEIALAEWQRRPWLGVGPGGGEFLFAPVEHGHAHNVAVQALLDWGALGAVPALLLLGLLLRRAVVGVAGEPDEGLRAARAVAAAYLIGAAVNGAVDGPFSDARSLVFLALAAAVVLLPAGGGGASKPASLSPRARFRVLSGATLTAALFVVHLLAVHALWAPGTPAPGSARVRLLQAAPTPSNLHEVAHWARAWEAEDPAAALALAEWGGRHAYLPVPFLLLEGDLLLRLGDPARAAARHGEARRRQDAAVRLRRALRLDEAP